MREDQVKFVLKKAHLWYSVSDVPSSKVSEWILRRTMAAVNVGSNIMDQKFWPFRNAHELIYGSPGANLPLITTIRHFTSKVEEERKDEIERKLQLSYLTRTYPFCGGYPFTLFT